MKPQKDSESMTCKEYLVQTHLDTIWCRDCGRCLWLQINATRARTLHTPSRDADRSRFVFKFACRSLVDGSWVNLVASRVVSVVGLLLAVVVVVNQSSLAVVLKESICVGSKKLGQEVWTIGTCYSITTTTTTR